MICGPLKVSCSSPAPSAYFSLFSIFCYGWLSECGLTWTAFDRILLSIQRTTLLFSHPITTKLSCLLFLALGCYGTKSVRNGKVGRRHIAGAVSLGFPLFFLNGPLLELPAAVTSIGVPQRAISRPSLWDISACWPPGSGCGA